MTTFVTRLLDLWLQPLDERADPEADFRGLYHETVTVNGATMTAADLVARARAVQATYADLAIEVIHELHDDDHVVIAFHMLGRHVGPLATPVGTVPPTDRSIVIRVTDVLTLHDGRVADIWMISDDFDLLRQLGAVTVPAVRGQGMPG